MNGYWRFMGRMNDAENSLKTVQAFARAMRHHHTLDGLLWDIAEQVGELLGFDDCVIYMRQGEILVQAAAYGLKNPGPHEIMDPIIIPVGEGIVGTVALTGQAEYVANTVADQRYIADHYDGASELAVPVVFDGEVIGVFDSESDLLDGYSELDRSQFQLIADMASARIAWLGSERSRLAFLERHDAERLESLGLLAGGIAHDFNNLLAVIALHTEAIRYAEDDEEREMALDTVEDVVRRASTLTKQLVTFARGGTPVVELLDPASLLQECSRYVVAMTGIELVLQVSEDLPLINADPTQVGQVLHNLLLNGAEAMGQCGRIHVVAEACAHEGGPGLSIEVTDEGPGMDADTVGQIFDPYFSTKQRGSGLGLASSYWIASRHGGHLSCASELGHGSTFRLVLPALAGKLPQATSIGRLEPLAPMRVLVLEDERQVAEGLVNLLRRHRHTVTWVMDGSEVGPLWARAQRDGMPFDLALLDLKNPGGVGGVEALGELLSVDPLGRAVAMSGYTEGDGMRDYAALGFVARLEKPFDMKALEKAMRFAIKEPVAQESM
jgi:signal transduction histidine kinase